MKIVTLNLYVFLVILALITVGLSMPQITTPSFANVFDSKNVYSISTVDENHPVNTFVWSSLPSSISSSASSSLSSSNMAEMSDILTASFTNIIDTQIYTGLDQISN
ncbi:hypothetical protein [Candidatus Nitrosocosmicus franklandus]|uniref:hypothetical protein n=1 Tax=Candidatus Nitrosocosmicus franklandianus TaxID=1798806 RepID=UPI00106C21BE|nr:hypothetical protein [Candidatus Nitrosocosmicus franklandus]